ncbi:hypothetical protein QE152_g966 [Popillia japonica]|uniref:Uncharacterized protein n=1 Tax=Popillia japonica TaxID=7064 RepID=A0AAW1N9L3_POPJA
MDHWKIWCSRTPWCLSVGGARAKSLCFESLSRGGPVEVQQEFSHSGSLFGNILIDLPLLDMSSDVAFAGMDHWKFWCPRTPWCLSIGGARVKSLWF